MKKISPYISFVNQIHLANLREIEVISGFTQRAYDFICNIRNIKPEIAMTWRSIVLDIDQFNTLLKLSKDLSFVLFKVYVSPKLKAYYRGKLPENIYWKFWSIDIDEIYKNNDIDILPVIYDRDSQAALIKEVSLSENDILATKKSLQSLRYDSIFNRSFMSHLWLHGEEVYVANQFVGKIETFPQDFNKWFYQKNNLWFYTRRDKQICKDCAFVDLCPSISIAETIGVFTKACL